MRNETIIGRRDEIETLERFVAQVPDGFGSLLLEGEAGAGKTTLWQRAVDRARAAGWRVLVARAAEVEATLAFAGLADLLADEVEDVLEDLPPIQRRALEAVLLLGDAPAEANERAVGAATHSALTALAGHRPLLIAVDDAQWLDVPSLHALEFALRRLRDEPVGLLATVRVESGAAPTFALTSTIGADRAERLWVGPLSAGAIYELIRTRLGHSVSRPALLRLHELSGGNPFFALELARADPDSLAVPRGVRELLRARLAALSAEATQVLVATAGLRDRGVDVIERALADMDVAAAVREAAELGLVEVHGGRVHFVHPLLASTLYEDASPRQLRELHRRLAAAVAIPEERARHLALSAEAPNEEIAAALELGAVSVEARGSLTAASELSSRAVELTPPGEREALHRRRLAAARRSFAAGDTAQAKALLAAAEADATPGVERAQVLHELSRVARAADDLRVAHALSREAADEAADDPRLRAEILASSVSLIGYWGEGYEAAYVRAEEAVALAEQSGDEVILARALAARADVAYPLGRGCDTPAFQRAEDLATRAGAARIASGIAYKHCELLIDLRELEGVKERLERICSEARDRGDAWLSVPLLRLVMVEYETGDWDRALEILGELEHTSEQTGWNLLKPLVETARGLIEGSRGNVDVARERVLAALEETERRGRLSRYPLGVLAAIELSVERYGEAYDRLELVLERNRERGVRGTGFICEAAEALVGLDRLDEAEALLDEYTRPGESVGRAAQACALRARGLLAAARGDLVEAEARLGESVRGWRELALPLELGRSLLALGTVRRRARKKRDARDALDEAVGVFEHLGARIWAERASGEAARIGGRAAPRDGLSGTEDAIATLVAAGSSNREVAEALHLSRHTVEWNLARIYRKLGIHSRTQLAAARAVREQHH